MPVQVGLLNGYVLGQDLKNIPLNQLMDVILGADSQDVTQSDGGLAPAAQRVLVTAPANNMF